MATFADRLKLLRQQKGITQEDLAKVLGVNKQTISGYERGVRRPAGENALEMYESIADYFNADLMYVLGHSDSITKLAGAPADDSVDLSAGVAVTLAADERALIKAYRMASADTKAACRAVLGVKP